MQFSSFNLFQLIFAISYLADDAECSLRSIFRKTMTKSGSKCVDPPNLKDELAAWMRESMEGEVGATNDDLQWRSKAPEPEICSKPPSTEGEAATVMQRALCPWESRVNFDETRQPSILAEAVCLCRRSRGASGAFCLPIYRDVAILRRGSCDAETGYYTYSRSMISITVGCHSVLPRTQRAVPMGKLFKRHHRPEEV